MKKLKKKKLAVKGMTLVECIVALLVFGIMALMMVQIGTITSKLVINANHMNNKTTKQAPVAQVRDTNATGLTNITLVEIKVESGKSVKTMRAHKYDTGELDGMGDDRYKTSMDGNLMFYDIQRETQPTT